MTYQVRNQEQQVLSLLARTKGFLKRQELLKRLWYDQRSAVEEKADRGRPERDSA